VNWFPEERVELGKELAENFILSLENSRSILLTTVDYDLPISSLLIGVH